MSTEISVLSDTDLWGRVADRIWRHCQKEIYVFVEAGAGVNRKQVDDRLPDDWPGSTRRERFGGSQDTLHGLMRSLENYLSTSNTDETECKAKILWYSQEVVSEGQKRITMKMSITVAGRTGYATVSSYPYAASSSQSDRQMLFRPNNSLFLGEPTQSSSTGDDSSLLPMTVLGRAHGDISAHSMNGSHSVGHETRDGIPWWENNLAFGGGSRESVGFIQTTGPNVPGTIQAFSFESPGEGSWSAVDPELLKPVAASTMTTFTYGPG